MAPSIVETTIVEPTKSLRLQEQNAPKGSYAGGPEEFDHDREFKGSASQPPASYPNYLPVWDNEKSKWAYLVSSPPCYLLSVHLFTCFPLHSCLRDYACSSIRVDTLHSNHSNIMTMGKMQTRRWRIFYLKELPELPRSLLTLDLKFTGFNSVNWPRKARINWHCS